MAITPSDRTPEEDRRRHVVVDILETKIRGRMPTADEIRRSQDWLKKWIDKALLGPTWDRWESVELEAEHLAQMANYAKMATGLEVLRPQEPPDPSL